MMLMALMKAVYTSLNREQRQMLGQETVSFMKIFSFSYDPVAVHGSNLCPSKRTNNSFSEHQAYQK